MNIYINAIQFDRVLKNILSESKNDFRELTEEEEDDAYASFVVIKLSNGKIAATTRPYEKSKNKKIGLPGGKVEKGETPKEAAYRECKEEGWGVKKINKIIASKMVDGNPIVWFEGSDATMLKTYKEKESGIEPLEVSIEEISKTGYGNSFIKEYFGSEKELKEEGETSSAPSTSSSGGGSGGGAQGYPQVGKWESGVTRGAGNQIGVTKWSDVVGSTIKRGKGNPLK